MGSISKFRSVLSKVSGSFLEAGTGNEQDHFEEKSYYDDVIVGSSFESKGKLSFFVSVHSSIAILSRKRTFRHFRAIQPERSLSKTFLVAMNEKINLYQRFHKNSYCSILNNYWMRFL